MPLRVKVVRVLKGNAYPFKGVLLLEEDWAVPCHDAQGSARHACAA